MKGSVTKGRTKREREGGGAVNVPQSALSKQDCALDGAL
jgi:hypothetical protein